MIIIFENAAQAQFVPTLPSDQCSVNAYGWLAPFTPQTGTLPGEQPPSYNLYNGGWSYGANGYPVRANTTPNSSLVLSPNTKPTELDSNTLSPGEEWLMVSRKEGRVGTFDSETVTYNDLGGQEHSFFGVFDSAGNLLGKNPTAANTSNFGTLNLSYSVNFTYPADGIVYTYLWVADYKAAFKVYSVDSCRLDYGDAPDTYSTLSASNGPTHITGAHYLGTNRNHENDATTSSGNASDDSHDDGITVPAIVLGETVTLTANVNGANGYLNGWIDWNGDGDFADAGEQIAVDLQDNGTGQDATASDGILTFDITAPASATTSMTFSRFRWSKDSGLSFNGAGSTGEVEDYAMTFMPATPNMSLTKTASAPGFITGNIIDAPVGTTITYTYVVTNTGNVAINNVSISDTHNGTAPPPVPGTETLTNDAGTIGDSSDSAPDGVWDSLGVGDEITFTATYTITQADLDSL